jgi:hypothetical protein
MHFSNHLKLFRYCEDRSPTAIEHQPLLDRLKRGNNLVPFSSQLNCLCQSEDQRDNIVARLYISPWFTRCLKMVKPHDNLLTAWFGDMQDIQACIKPLRQNDCPNQGYHADVESRTVIDSQLEHMDGKF